MVKSKCNHCGVIDSLHVSDKANSKLVSEKYLRRGMGGLDIYAIYCRCCLFVSFYEPGWFGNIKPTRNISGNCVVEDGVEMVQQHLTQGDTWRLDYFFCNKDQPIFRAMIEDGVFEVDWEEYLNPTEVRITPINHDPPTRHGPLTQEELDAGLAILHSIQGKPDQQKLKQYKRIDSFPKKSRF